MDYLNEFKRDTGKEPTKLQIAQANNLVALDTKCTLCKQGDTMLCGGIRPEYLKAAGRKQRRVIIEAVPCDKLHKLSVENTKQERLKASGVPPSFYETRMASPKFLITDSGVRYGDTPFFRQSRGSTKAPPTKELWEAVIAAINNGYRAKFLYPPVVLSAYKNQQDRMIDDYVTKCDWLVVEHFDYNNGAGYLQDMLAHTVKYRMDSGLPTLIRMSDNPVARNDLDFMVYKEVMTWNELTW